MSALPSRIAEQLVHRRQFLLAPRVIQAYASWHSVVVAGRLNLYAHPDLNVTVVHTGSVEMTLLGFVLNPETPSATNEEILLDIGSRLRTVSDACNLTENLGGRFVLIVYDGSNCILFADASGQRQIVYAKGTDGTWCASQPSLIAAEQGYTYGEGSLIEFMESDFFRKREYWWPGDSSPFSEISALLPNHALDVIVGRISRFWPSRPIERLTPKDAIERCSSTLCGLAKAAHFRFKLALPITSGIDSRLVLAAVRDVADDLYLYTLVYHDLTVESPDVAVPREMLRDLGLTHNVHDCSSPLQAEFSNLYERNVMLAHRDWAGIVQGLCQVFPSDRVSLKGNGSPIGKCHYHKYYYPKRVDPAYIARVTHMPGNKFVIEHQKKWYLDARDAEIKTGYTILDLLYWEQREGVWQAQSQLEFDLAHEQLTLFNCRRLLATILAVDAKYRRPPRYAFFEDLARFMWPEIMRYPVNPEPWRARLDTTLKAWIGQLYGMVRT